MPPDVTDLSAPDAPREGPRRPASGRLDVMSTSAQASRLSGVGWGTPLARLAVGAGQILLIVGTGWLWLTGSSDASATTVDWSYVWLAIATPITFAVSGLVGWKSTRRAVSPGSLAARSFTVVTQWTTIGLLALSVLLAPIALLGALVFDPMG